MKHAILTPVIAFSLLLNCLPALAGLDPDHPDYNIPDLIAPSTTRSPTAAPSSLNTAASDGLRDLREERGDGSTIEDPELSVWLRNLGNKLLAHAPVGNNRFYFVLSKDLDVNAFATQGGVIVINAGLILTTTSESELAAVMAHEIAHVTQHHMTRMANGSPNSALMTGLGVLAGAAAATKSTDAGEAIIASTVATQAHQQLGFSRQMEAEADRVGLRILAASGFDPQGMASFMEKLDRRSNDLNNDITQFLRSHPLDIDRVSDTRSRATNLHTRAVTESPDYRYAREKLRALLQPTTGAVTQGDAALAQYAQAVRQMRSGNAKAVLQTLGTTANGLPTTLLLAQALNASGNPTETIKRLTPFASTAQENVLTPLAEAYLANNQAAQAWQTVSHCQLTEQTSLEFLDLRQRVAEQNGQAAEAYRSAAERSLRSGEYRQAQAVLEQATRLPGTPAATAARLQVMAQEIARLENATKQRNH